MDMMDVLKSSGNDEAYRLLLSLEKESAETNRLYPLLEEFTALTQSKSSLVRVRGFRLACAQARWDTEHRFDKCLETLLTMLDDHKATAVRQCLKALESVALCRPDLHDRIRQKLSGMELSKYKDSMRPLIQKDMEQLQALLSPRLA
ncbi:MAG: SufBD protein [Oscillospiraceae bacterium]|nr:SufBD protein [Oscillospiraceae bacterium]